MNIEGVGDGVIKWPKDTIFNFQRTNIKSSSNNKMSILKIPSKFNLIKY